MIEVKIGKNDSNQRFDRFLRKYFKNASLSVIQKNIRKKNFKINDKRAKKDDLICEGDLVKMYIKDEDYNKWVNTRKFKDCDFNIDIIYEDDNIVVIDKKKGVLSHAASPKDYGNNIVDQMTSYLYKTNKVDSRDLTFKPSIVNRLDRNTAGLIIGAKNARALRELNKAIKNSQIHKYYLTIVEGKVDKDFTIDTNIIKNENKNIVKSNEDGKRIITKFHPLDINDKYSLLECKLITGRTHQIRYSLFKNDTPIIGDRKYFKSGIDYRKYGLDSQVLLAYKLSFNTKGFLSYLNNKEIKSNQTKDLLKLKEKVFNESYTR